MTLERAASEDHSFSGSRTRGRDPEVLTISTSWLIIITALHTICIPKAQHLLSHYYYYHNYYNNKNSNNNNNYYYYYYYYL